MQTMHPSAGDLTEPRKPEVAPSFHSGNILGMRVDCSDYDEAVEFITRLGRSGQGGMVCVASVHMVMEAFDHPGFRRTVNIADMVTSDGVPLVWALRMLGLVRAQRVYGPSLTPRLCAQAEQEGLRVGFIGGTQEVLDSLTLRLRRDYPSLDIAFVHSPPFRVIDEDEDAALIETIRDAGVHVLFVGLGCPKQERWMASHRDALPCVMVGVGAAFDFLAGAKRQAPSWMQNAGLEWLFRLCTEPVRLWHRYLYHNPRFLYAFANQLWRRHIALRLQDRH